VGHPAIEVADSFCTHGPAWRAEQHGQLSLPQLKVMSAIEQCRTAALGGHALRCEGCGVEQISYNSCRNRHTSVLHTWGSALTHHPHVHGVVPGGGLSADGKSWVAFRPGFFLSVRVLSRQFRRRFLEELVARHRAGQLKFFGAQAALADAKTFAKWLTPLRRCEWVVYAKRPFAAPEAVLACLSRYTHRVAISNSRLLSMDDRGVTFRWKDYRVKDGTPGKTRHKTMTLGADEFMRRFLLHVLPNRFHRIRHCGLLANGCHKTSIALARTLLGQPNPSPTATEDSAAEISEDKPRFVCRHCGAAMIVVQIFARDVQIRAPPARPSTS